MHSTDVWHKFNLHWCKVVICLTLFALCKPLSGQSQVAGSLNLPNFDNQKVHYGFLIGLHSSRFGLRYSDEFVELELDTLHSIVPRGSMGFKLGFIVDFHLFEIFDIRLTPTVGFNQLSLDYIINDGTPNGTSLEELIDPTYVELPILAKYKSVRRLNRRMYFLAGLNPAVRASGSRDKEIDEERLLLNQFNLSLDIGAGFDLYQPLYKLSPEIRYSFGLTNVLNQNDPNLFSVGLDRLAIHTIAFYITFEGGPSELKKVTKKKRP